MAGPHPSPCNTMALCGTISISGLNLSFPLVVVEGLSDRRDLKQPRREGKGCKAGDRRQGV